MFPCDPSAKRQRAAVIADHANARTCSSQSLIMLHFPLTLQQPRDLSTRDSKSMRARVWKLELWNVPSTILRKKDPLIR